MQTFPRATFTSRLRDDPYSSTPDSPTSAQPTLTPDVVQHGYDVLQDGGVEQSSLQGRCYSETATSPVTTGHHVHPLDVVAPEEVLKHHQLSASDVFSVQRQRSTTDVVRRTKIKRFPTIMTPSYGRSGNGISKGPLLRGQFYSKTEKMTVLSPDMEAKIYEKICRSLGAKYGSLERATQAAVTIQKTYRGYKLRRHFEEIRREGNVQLFRRCSLDARERRNYLTMGRRDKAAAGAVADPLATAGSGGRAMERGVVQVGSDSPPPHAGLSQTGKGGQSAMDVGVAMEGVVLRRSKSHSAVLTKRIREEGEEMEEEEDEEEEGENGWNKTVGVHLFNRKPASGIQYLISKGIIRDTPRSVAKFLKEQSGLSKMKIGEFIGEIRYEFNMAVLEHLAHSMDMKDKPIDEALRTFQKLFLMPGEAQKIDKIMQIFAAEYVKANRGVFETEDAAYILSFSIMMLHTSLHNPSVKHRTSKEQWLKMNRGINNGRDFPETFLLGIYDRILKTPFVTGRDHTHQVMEIQQKLVGSDILKPNAPHRTFVVEVNVFEQDKVNHWLKGKHKRTLLLFSDLVVVAKKNKEQYMFKQSIALHDVVAVPFQSAHKHGIQIYSSVDRNLLFQCCCRTKSEYDGLFKNFNDTVKLLNVLEKERIAASQEQPHRHTNVGLPSMKVSDFGSTQPQFMAKSMDFLPGVGALQCSTEITHSLRPLSATNLAMPLENLHLLGDISKSVKGHHGSDNVARSLCRHGSVDEKENSFAEYPLSNAVVQPASEQKTRDVRPSLVKVDRGLLCGGDVDDLNPLISYGRHGNTVGMPIQV
ncbi:hypothetical protein EMCRGX_G000765 [Ephydatia muelleri]|eukprot:Em0001g610a